MIINWDKINKSKSKLRDIGDVANYSTYTNKPLRVGSSDNIETWDEYEDDIKDFTRSAITVTATGLDYDSDTGILSLSSEYKILTLNEYSTLAALSHEHSNFSVLEATQESFTSTKSSQYDAAYTHVSSNGTDHSYINQDVSSSGTPTFSEVTGAICLTPATDVMAGAYSNSTTLTLNDNESFIAYSGMGADCSLTLHPCANTQPKFVFVQKLQAANTVNVQPSSSEVFFSQGTSYANIAISGGSDFALLLSVYPSGWQVLSQSSGNVLT